MATIDGKPVRRFLFARWVVITQTTLLTEVEAFTLDHAIKRLCDEYPHIEKRQWDFIDVLAPGHFVGKMGLTLPLRTMLTVIK